MFKIRHEELANYIDSSIVIDQDIRDAAGSIGLDLSEIENLSEEKDISKLLRKLEGLEENDYLISDYDHIVEKFHKGVISLIIEKLRFFDIDIIIHNL